MTDPRIRETAIRNDGAWPVAPVAGLRFSKMHGAGNDFVILDLTAQPPPSPALCSALADRRFGVGCDLILGVGAPTDPKSIASYQIWTAEGKPSMQCGNGARCVAAWLRRRDASVPERFRLDSPSGQVDVVQRDQNLFQVSMGTPNFSPGALPLHGVYQASDRYETKLEDGAPIRFAALSLGNPHVVIEVANIDTAPVATTGPALQQAEMFPPEVNVGFVEPAARDLIRLRVFEFGSGETLACGSGACAAAAALMRQGRIDRSVRVQMAGGCLEINWPDDHGEVFMTGPAEFVFEGEYDHASL